MRWLAEFLLPTICMGCSWEGEIWCESCSQHFVSQPFEVDVGSDIAVKSLGSYQGPIAKLINLAKEKCSPVAQRVLADSLVRVVDSLLAEKNRTGHEVVLVPIPAGRAAIRRRGADPIKEMARLAGSRLQPSIPVLAGLGNSRQRLEQSGLSIAERSQNTFGSFVWVAANFRSQAVILVDDVVTTGATLIAAADAVRKSGHEVIGCATVAATRRWAHRKQAV